VERGMNELLLELTVHVGTKTDWKVHRVHNQTWTLIYWFLFLNLITH